MLSSWRFDVLYRLHPTAEQPCDVQIPEVEQLSAVNTCKLRRRDLPKDTPGRLKGKTFQRRPRLTVQSLLYRNVGAGTLDKWTQDQKKDFFRKAGATAPDDHGRRSRRW